MECKVIKYNGINVIDIDGKKFPPMSFKTFRACDRNISDFYRAGIRLFCIVECAIDNSLGNPYSHFGESWIDDEVYDFSGVDRQIELFMKNAPDGYFALMLSVDTRQWWLEKRAGYANSYFELSKMEADPLWRRSAASYMQALLSHVEGKYGDRVFGYFIFCGTTTEWFSEQSREEPSEISLAAYRKWRGDEKAHIPTRELREGAEDRIFLDHEADRELIEYRRFEAWQRTDTILYFAKKAHEVLKHKKLLGVYFGYIFELHAPRLWNTCALDYERIFLSEDIDMIANPISYNYRGQNDSSHGMVADTTLALHNKICFYEHDQTTCLVPDIIEGKPFAHPCKAATVEEDVNLLRRDFMLSLSRGCAMWWFDMFGGWFYDDRFMSEIGRMIKITEKFSTIDHRSQAEIAVVIDPDSLYYVNKNCKLSEMLFRWQREGLSEMGAPYDLLSACDIGRLCEGKYKLVIFLDQFRRTAEADAMLCQLREQKTTLLFLYAHNLVDGEGKFNPAAMNDSLGMTLYPHAAEDTMILADGNRSQTRWKCACYAIEEGQGVMVLGRYEGSGAAAMGYVRRDGAVVAFSGLGMLNGHALAPILALAGVHRYADGADVAVYVSSNMIGVYHRREDDAYLHTGDGEWVDLFGGDLYRAERGTVKIPYGGVRAKLLVSKRLFEAMEYDVRK